MNWSCDGPKAHGVVEFLKTPQMLAFKEDEHCCVVSLRNVGCKNVNNFVGSGLNRLFNGVQTQMT